MYPRDNLIPGVAIQVMHCNHSNQGNKSIKLSVYPAWKSCPMGTDYKCFCNPYLAQEDQVSQGEEIFGERE